MVASSKALPPNQPPTIKAPENQRTRPKFMQISGAKPLDETQEPDRGFAQRVVQGVTDGPARGDQPLQHQRFTVMYCSVLTSGVTIKPDPT